MEAPAKRPAYTLRERALERSLIFNFLVHGLAMLSMAALLLPTLPGGTATSEAARIATIAAHPWRFRLGWLPWQLCAVADLTMALAMVRVRWLPSAASWSVLALTLVAVAPDQYAQAVWVTRGVTLAAADPEGYLALERALFPLTAGWGALFYTLGALGWTVCFARGGTWSRALTLLSGPTWATMAVAVVSPLLPPGMRPGPVFVSAANGLGFLQLQVWLGLVTEAVLFRARPYEATGRLARWRHPGSGLFARLADGLANSRLAGALLEPLPEVEMRSDIRDVVYVNYLVPAAMLEALVPEGLELERLGPDGKYALFTFLSYQHGHFGFAFLGPARRFLPSPVQTNWRVHVRDPRTGHDGIAFVTNAISSVVPALGARLLTEGMPMHVLERAEVTRAEDGAITVSLRPGAGSAPDAELRLRPRPAPHVLTGAWAECWSSFDAFLAYCVPQDRAMSSQPLRGRISRQEIDLGIPLTACRSLEGTVVSRAARALVGDAAPLCFHVDRVSFSFSVEAHDPGPDAAKEASMTRAPNRSIRSSFRRFTPPCSVAPARPSAALRTTHTCKVAGALGVLVLVACGARTGDTPDCAELQAEALALIEPQRACTVDADCVLFTSPLTCKGQGVRVGTDTTALEAKVLAFTACVTASRGCEACAKPAYRCKLDYVVAGRACSGGRCVSDVDDYAHAPRAASGGR